MDSEENLAMHYASFAGFLGVESIGNGVIVRFERRQLAESAIMSIPPGFSKGIWFNPPNGQN